MNHTDDDRLTPEERADAAAADIEAILDRYDVELATRGVHALIQCDGNETEIVPTHLRQRTVQHQRFEAYKARYHGSWGDGGRLHSTPDEFSDDVEVWRCTVTPIERVR